MTLTPLEKDALTTCLAGEDGSLDALRGQTESLKVVSREITGVGFYTEFEISPETRRLDGRPSFKLSDVFGTAKNLDHGFGFVLYVKDGAIEPLEGYTFDEPWPDQPLGVTLTYLGGGERNMDDLRKTIRGSGAS